MNRGYFSSSDMCKWNLKSTLEGEHSINSFDVDNQHFRCEFNLCHGSILSYLSFWCFLIVSPPSKKCITVVSLRASVAGIRRPGFYRKEEKEEEFLRRRGREQRELCTQQETYQRRRKALARETA